jgi:hypothetical protein
MAHDMQFGMYLIDRGQALGPLPRHVWTNDNINVRQIIPIHEIEASGIKWHPLSTDLRYPFAWYTLQDSSEGRAFVDRTAGYYAALRSFLASETAATMFSIEGLAAPWAFPYARLFSSGAWETGDDTLTQSIILPVWAPRADVADGMKEDLDEAIAFFQPWGCVQSSEWV